MSDAEDDTPKPRSWTQWAQDNWQWLLPLGLVVLAGLVAAILWYYRAAPPQTAPPAPTVSNVSVAANLPPVAPPALTGAATYVPGAAASVPVAGAYRVQTAQFVDYANLTALQQTPGAQYNDVAGIPQVALATGQVYYSAFPQPQR